MYKQPTTEAYDLISDNLMLSVSPGKPENPDSPPEVHAPSRKGDQIPY